MQKHPWILLCLAFAVSGLCGFIFSLYMHSSPSNNITTIQTFHYPALFVKQIAGDSHAGEKIFKEFCSACHSKNPQIDINAPHIGDRKLWQAYSKLGTSKLLDITIKGRGAMPARGGCFECDDDQLRITIEYILNNSK